MLATLPAWLETLSTDIAKLWPLWVAITAGVSVVVATKATLTRVIRDHTDPIANEVENIKGQFVTNDGGSMRDRQEAVLDRLGALMTLVERHEVSLSVLWETAPEAFYVSDATGHTTQVNQAYLDLWGFDDPAQARTDEWLSQLTDESLRLAHERVSAVFSGESHPPFSFGSELKDGRTIRVVGKPFHRAGEFAGYAGVVIDLAAESLGDVTHYLEDLQAKLLAHIEWEETVKYPEVVRDA